MNEYEMDGDYLIVDWYVMGEYRGKRRIHKDGLCGRLLLGNFGGIADKTRAMEAELNSIPGVKARVVISKGAR